MSTAPKKIAVYIRVSTISQSYESQEQAIKNFIAARGWKEEDCIFEREKGSGASASRPGLDRLMMMARADEISTIVVYKIDRLGRNATHLLWCMEELERMNVALISATQPIDTSDKNPVGRLVAQIMSSVAELDKELVRERTLAGQAAARRRGVTFGRPRTIDRHQPKAIALRKSGKTIAAIAAQLGISCSATQRLVAGVDAGRPDKRLKRLAQKYPPKNQLPLALEN
jgi:DNA invertase Pin-like site-specific DNA recombinase